MKLQFSLLGFAPLLVAAKNFVPGSLASSSFTGFKCPVIERPANWAGLETGVKAKLNDYVKASYVYGSTSHPERCQPRAIVFARTEEDIIKTIEYAHREGCAVSCRSGSHQFGGFGSSSGKDIALDLSSFDRAEYCQESDVYTIGVGTKLGDLSAMMRSRGQFIPHGECSWVRVGGHMQTGGYSPFFSSSFGFFCDHVLEFTIILPPNRENPKSRKVVVTKPEKRVPGNLNSDLWWAVQGGSPGNFGVITEMKVKGINDAYHQDARAMSITFTYDKRGKEKLQTFLEILSEYNDDENLPADYAFNVICLAGAYIIDFADISQNGELSYHLVCTSGNSPWSKIQKERQNLDVKMAMKHPEIFGPHLGKVPAFVSLIVTWNNVKGRRVKFDDYDGKYCAKEIFADIRRRTSGIAVTPSDYLLRFLGRLKMEVLCMNENKPRALSEINKICSFSERYGANPYVGMQRWNDSNHLSKFRSTKRYKGKSYSAAVAEVADQAMRQREEGVWLTPQWGTVGGKYSMIRKENSKNPNVLSHRGASMSHLYYIHFDNVQKGHDTNDPKKRAKRNLNKMVQCTNALMGRRDRRWLAFCGEDENLDLLHSHYYDTEEDYQDLLTLKRRIDPHDIFTPNLFAIGASRKFQVAPLGIVSEKSEVQAFLPSFNSTVEEVMIGGNSTAGDVAIGGNSTEEEVIGK